MHNCFNGLDRSGAVNTPDFRLKLLLEELTMASEASLVMSPDDTSSATGPICM